MGAVDSPFYRTGLGVPAYPGYSPSLLHPGGLAGTPFAPPNHATPFAPKVSQFHSYHFHILFFLHGIDHSLPFIHQMHQFITGTKMIKKIHLFSI